MEHQESLTMNRYTKDFHSSTFPGYKVSKTLEEILPNFWHSDQIPFIDIDLKFEHGPTHDWLIDNHHLFVESRSQLQDRLKHEQNDQTWFALSRSNGWKGIHVKGNSYQKTDIVTSNEKYVAVDTPQFKDAVPEVVESFNNNNLPLKRLWVFCLEPGGWLQPHKDVVPAGSPGLTQFWMPLHDFPECLKIYPYGYLQHQVGHVYLFNNPKFVHSVINQTSENRYAAFGEIDLELLPADTKNRIVESMIKQWF